MIKICQTSQLEPALKAELDNLVENEFGHIPIVRETKWASPDWTIIFYENDRISTFYNIIERRILVDSTEVLAAGINNVITPPQFRGKGFSTRILKDTEGFIFKEIGVDMGLLLCADDLIPFYKRLGWYKVNCPVYFDQPPVKKLWKANTMLRTLGSTLSPGEIDLNGLPW